MQTLSSGCLLQHGYYRIDKVLGQGGFGITYLATDLNLQRQVAIKEFFPKAFCDRDETTSHVTLGTSSTSEFVNRLKAKFLKEARNIAKLDHPNIIRIYAAFEENNTAYYVMEYIEGETLSAMVKRGGPIAEKQALEYIEKVGNALECIHEKKINHLDIKPANIMVRSSNNTPVLIDFGLSKQYDSEGNQTSTMPPGFSHGYAPMEQYNEGGVRDFSPQTDIYSLAATLYYILSGVVPIQATRRNDEELTFPAPIPPRLVDAIAKAMSPGRKKRHASVQQFIADLKKSDKTESSAKAPEPAKVGDETEIPVVEIKQKPQEVTASDSGSIPPNDDEPELTPETWPDEESWFTEEAEDVQPNMKKLYVIISAVVAACLVIGIGFWMNSSKDTSQPEQGETVKEAPKATNSVSDVEWISPLGKAIYSGEVKEAADSLPIDRKVISLGEKNVIPNGKGMAKITDGQYAGNVYDGTFIDGVMEGQTTYTQKNGDIFKGTFKNNMYNQGRYTIKATGEYFEGTFKKSNPAVGKWYDKKGNVVDELK